MIVTIHQPEHLPWLGFFNKMIKADVFVFLDNVQYRKNYFQNRNRIYGTNGPMWITVPVLTKGYFPMSIKDMRINNDNDWCTKCWKKIYFTYKKHPFFERYAERLNIIYTKKWDYLVNINYEIINFFVQSLGIDKKFIIASSLKVEGSGSQLLLNICKALGANVYLSGPSGKDYLDEIPFDEAEIKVIYNDFKHPEYPQYGQSQFQPNLSVLDLLFNCGLKSLRIIEEG
jgi:hypothetical protein